MRVGLAARPLNTRLLLEQGVEAAAKDVRVPLPTQEAVRRPAPIPAPEPQHREEEPEDSGLSMNSGL